MKTGFVLKHLFTYWFILMAILFLTSCNEPEGCNQSTNVFLRMDFYQLEAGEETSYTLPDLTVYGVTKPDSLIYDDVSNLTSINLPLSNARDQCAFVFVSENVYDTISFQYSSELTLLSIDCGFINIFNIKKIDANYTLLDSLFIRQPEIDANEEENVKLYF